MKTKLTATVAICALAAGATALALGRPPAQQTVAAAAAPAAQTTDQGAHEGHGVHGGADAGGQEAAAAPAGVVTIESFAFAVGGTFAPGETITVTNLDSAPHTLTATDGSFDTGTIEGGASVQLVLPATAGNFEFFCAVHPSMTGVLTIA